MRKISVKNINGTVEQVDLINSFRIKEIGKEFVILSKGEAAGEGMSKIYISEVIEKEPGIFNLVGIKDDEIWKIVKQAMKQIVEG